MDRFEAARRVFGVFRSSYERYERDGYTGIWTVTIEPDEAQEIGLTPEQARAAIGLLKAKGLIKLMGTVAHRLTDDGTECCIHPELLDQFLGPPVRSVSSQQFNFTGNQIQGLVKAIEQDDSIPVAKKSEWTNTLKEIAVSTVSGVAVAIAQGAMGS